MTRKKGGGGKLNRSEIIQARLDPRLHMAAELMARMERRTLSSFIERSIEQMGKTQKIKRNLFNSWMSPDYEIFSRDQLYSISDEVTVEQAVYDINANHEAIKFFKFASYFPDLLSHEEEELFRGIISVSYFWMYYPINTEDQTGKVVHKTWAQVNAFEGLIQENLINYWEDLKTDPAKQTELESSLPIGKKISGPLKQDTMAIKKYIQLNDPKQPHKVIYAWDEKPIIAISTEEIFWKKRAKKLLTKKIEVKQTVDGYEIVTTLTPPSDKEERKAWVEFYKEKIKEITNGD